MWSGLYCSAQTSNYNHALLIKEKAIDSSLNGGVIDNNYTALNMALMMVCKEGPAHAAQTLINFGADPRYTTCQDPGEWEKIGFEFVKFILFFIPRNAKLGQTCVSALKNAYRNDQLEVALLLARAGAFDQYVLESAMRENQTELVDLLLKKGDWSDEDDLNRGLTYACRSGSLEWVEYFLDKGAKVEDTFDKRELIYDVVQSGNVDMLRLMVENGVEYQQHHFSCGPEEDYSCNDYVNTAIDNGDLEMVRYLREIGVYFYPRHVERALSLSVSLEFLEELLKGLKRVDLAQGVMEHCPEDESYRKLLNSYKIFDRNEMEAAVIRGKRLSRHPKYRDKYVFYTDYLDSLVLFDEEGLLDARYRYMSRHVDTYNTKELKWLLSHTNCEIYRYQSDHFFDSDTMLYFRSAILGKKSWKHEEYIHFMIEAEPDASQRLRIIRHCRNRLPSKPKKKLLKFLDALEERYK